METTAPRGREGPAAALETYGATAFANAWRSPFFRRRLEAAAIPEGVVPHPDAFSRIEPTTKEQLRDLSPEQFQAEIVIADRTEVATVWRSGGVTGRPLFYPRARADFPALRESFGRVLDMAGVRPGDLMLNSFPLGVHPLGHMFFSAAEDRGIGCIPAGSGTNTPTMAQVRLLHDLRPTVFAGLASYFVHLGHVGASLGLDPRQAGVRVIITSGEPITPAKRRRIEATWGARLFDSFGMSECSMMGAECEAEDGFHVWSDLFQVEILDEARAWTAVPEGEGGQLVVTPLHNSHATPFLRWVSGDLASIHTTCTCSGPYSAFPRIRLLGRTSAFSKVKGVNIDHQAMEDVLLRLDDVADFAVWVEEADGEDRLRIEVEVAERAVASAAVEQVGHQVRAAFEVRPIVEVRQRGTIAGRLEGEVKQVRVRDVRE